MIETNVRFIGVLLLSGMAAVHDYESGHIPNWLVVIGLVLGAGGPIAASLDHAGLWLMLARAVGGFVACGAVPFFLFRLNMLGGGDVKLLATVGAQLGPTLGLELSFVAFVVAALYLPLRLARTRALLRALRDGVRHLSSRDRCGPVATSQSLTIAFAPCLFVAAVLVTTSHWST